jgi:Domain of unknown function (DUF4209)
MSAGTEESVQEINSLIDANPTADLSALARSAWTFAAAWETEHPGESVPSVFVWERAALSASAVRRQNRSSRESRAAFVGHDLDPLFGGESAYEYLAGRAQQTPNVAAKARYADLAWIAGRSLKRRDAHEHATAAIDAYLALSAQPPECEYFGFRLHRLDRAAELACELGRSKDGERVLQASFHALDGTALEERPGWLLDVHDTAELLGDRFPDLLAGSRWQELETMLLLGASHFAKELPPRVLAWQSLERAVRAAERASSPSRAWEYRLKILDLLEEDARVDETRRGAGIGLRHMRAVIDYCQTLLSTEPQGDIGRVLRDRLAVLRRELRRLVRSAEDEVKSHRQEIPADFPLVEWEKRVSFVLRQPEQDTIALLATMPGLRLDLAIPRAAVAATQDSTLVRDLTATSILRQGREKILAPAAENPVERLNRVLHFWFQLHLHNLDFVFSRLREQGRLTLDLFLAYFDAWPLADPADRPFLEWGIERFLAEDYGSTIHLLIPRIEHMLKSAFEQCGLPPIAIPSRMDIREETFGTFLSSPKVRELLGEDLWKYLHFSLVDEAGMNVRNEVAHGWLSAASCHHATASLVIFILLQIARVEGVPPAPAGGAQEQAGSTGNPA